MLSNFSDAMVGLNAAELAEFGEPITYIPSGGAGEPIQTVCRPRKPLIDQSSGPGYYADIDVDPAVIKNPQRRDVVIWQDGTPYVVNKVVNPPYGLATLAIHRKIDPL